MPYASRDPENVQLTHYSGRPTVQGMMGTRGRIADRFNAALAIWIVILGAIIPSLDREILSGEVVIGSGDHEACGRPHHDHTICVQFGRQDWSSSSWAPLRVVPPTVGESVGVRHDAPVEFLHRIPTHSRAPPDTT